MSKSKEKNDTPNEWSGNLYSNYASYCRNMNVTIDKDIASILREGDAPPYIQTIRFTKSVSCETIVAVFSCFLGYSESVFRNPDKIPVIYKFVENVTIENIPLNEAAAAVISSYLPCIRSLTICNCDLNEEHISLLAPVFVRSNKIESLSLTLNPMIGESGAIVTLCRGLRLNTSLKNLNLSFCGLSSTEPIAALVQSEFCSLVSIDLSGNPLRALGALPLAKAACKSRKLEELILTDTQLGNYSETAAGSLISISSVGTLSVRQDPINSVLKSPQNLSSSSAQALPSSAQFETPTQTLLKCLGEALSCPSSQATLKSLNIEANPMIETDAAVLIPFVTSENTKVQSLKPDSLLPKEIFRQLYRFPAPTKKKKAVQKKK